jgi:protein TonB
VEEVSANATPAAPPAPPAPPAAPADIAAGSDLSYGSRPNPHYPPQAVRQHHEGTVTLLILVGVDGVPKDIKVEKSSGFRELDRAAMDAARNWRFNPEVKGGRKVEGYARVPITFNLSGQM